MYSPKISKDLIPKIYRLACDKGMPMTKVVDAILRSALNQMAKDDNQKGGITDDRRNFTQKK